LSGSNHNKTSRTKITIVIGIAAIALFGTLLAIFSIGMTKPTSTSAIQANEEQILLTKAKELPEVKSFLHAHPNATIENISDNGGYSFSYEKPYPDQDFAQYAALFVVMNKLPDKEDIRAGEQKQYGEYYYYLEFRCGPAGLDDPNRASFSDQIWRQSDQLCESDKKAMNSTLK